MNRPEKQPNILFLFSDQHRWCDLGCYGNPEVISPNLDRLAQQGLRFTRCISNAPVCVPMRGSLLTAQMPMRHRAITNDLPIDTSLESVADVLNSAGYQTGYIGKWHLGGVPRDKPIPQEQRLGFSEWKVANCTHSYQNSYYFDEENIRHEIDGYDAETHTDLAIGFIHRNHETPWGLWVSWGPPHDPYFEVPDRWLDLYRDCKLSLRKNVPEQVLDRKDSPHLSTQDIEKNLHGYYAHISALDEQVGRLVSALEQAGQLDNTIIVYTSDHGDMLGSQGFTNKQLPYDEAVRVPLIVHGPENIRQGVSDELIGLVDLPVSTLSLAGLSFTTDVDGKNCSDLFFDPNAEGQEYCFIEELVPCHQADWRGSCDWRGVRTKQFTYACRTDGTDWLLFDNEADPFQQNNLVNHLESQSIKNHLKKQTLRLTADFDELAPWQRLIRNNGLSGEWNRSQQHFGLPLLQN